MEVPRIPDEASGIDLTEFCGSPVRFSHEDLLHLSENTHELFERIPEWDNIELKFENLLSPDGSLRLLRQSCFSNGSFGVACHATFVKNKRYTPCVVKVIELFNETDRAEALKEFMIHAVLTHTCASSPHIRERQEQGRMATIANLYAGFRVKGFRLEYVDDGRKKTTRVNAHSGAEYFVSVMQNAGAHTLKHKIHESTFNPYLISSVAAFAMYQISSLLEQLGDLLQFNHRDLHDENIMVQSRERRRMCGMTDMFACCVIDFGYSRLTFRGVDIMSSYEVLRDAGNPVQHYNNGHDTTYFLRTLRKVICGSVNVHDACTIAVIPELTELMNSVMMASGLDFESNACKSTTRKLITALTYVGDFDRLQECQGGVYANKTNVIRPYLYNPRTVKTLSAAVLRILGVYCFDSRNSVRLDETRAAFREALERDMTVDVTLEEISDEV